VVLKKALKN